MSGPSRPASRLVLGAFILLVLVLGVVWQAGSGRPGSDKAASQSAKAPGTPPTKAGTSNLTPETATRLERGPDPRAAAVAVVEKFDAWLLAERRNENPLAREGLSLAHARRAALKQLIALDPQAALQHAVPRALRSVLPAEIVADLETPIDAMGALEVTIACSETESRIERTIFLPGQRYQAHVFGRRLGTLSKNVLPVHGIAIDNELAVGDQPFRILEPDEIADLPTAADAVVVAVGDATRVFASRNELNVWSNAVALAEAAPGPGTQIGDVKLAAVTANWTTGTKRVLWIRADFPDVTGAQADQTTIESAMQTVSDYYRDVSGARCAMAVTVVPIVVRLPQNKSYYEADAARYRALCDSAVALAKQYDTSVGGAGVYNPDTYDRYIVQTKRVSVFSFSGIATVGNTFLYLNGTTSAGVIAHELGHNHGLHHAHAWQPTGSATFAPANHVEYGDPFDDMGTVTTNPILHFSTPQKEKLLYLDSSKVATIATGGVFRLYRHDDRNATALQALKINAGSYEYWIEHRETPPSSGFAFASQLQSGVLLHWNAYPATMNQGTGPYLLDATPGSSGEMNDAAAALGETFTDPNYGLAITSIAHGGTAPNEWVDVRVTFGATGTNRNPTVNAMIAGNTVPVRSDVTFAGFGVDPDGDTITYHWDFGDGQAEAIGAVVTHRWLKGGSFTVQCRAIDGRGGIATQNLNITVDDPLLNWTQRGAGITTSYLYGIVHDGSQYVVVGSNGAVLRSPNGVDWIQSTAFRGNLYGSLAYNGSRYVAVGSRYPNGAANPNPTIVSSSDGQTWTEFPVSTVSAYLRAIAWGAGNFVAVGDDGLVFVSADGIAWHQVDVGTTEGLYRVAFGNGRFVATGTHGTILTSTNGSNWQNRSIVYSGVLTSVAYHAGKWIVPTIEHTWTSSDATTWTDNANNLTASLYTLISAGTSPVLLASRPGGDLYLSEDGLTWQSIALPTGASFTVGSNNMFVADDTLTVLGTNGGIFQAQLTSSIRLPAIVSSQPQSQAVAAGGPLILNTTAAGPSLGFQWLQNGSAISGATATTLTLANLQPANTGIYTLAVTSAGVSIATQPAIVGLATTDKVLGAASEFQSNIHHPSGNIFDQLLLNGRAATFTADAGQVSRLSFVDLSNDIVQVEFSGAGTVSLVLANPSGPAVAANYNQPGVQYYRGHAGIVVTGANETTNLSVFSVGRATALNQALFRDDVVYDGFADLAFVAVLSPTGKFGGLRTANASYFATQGLTGIYAPGVQFDGPIYVGDIHATDATTPVFMIGGATGETRVAGGDLAQPNGRAVEVSGLTLLQFTDGSDSHGNIIPAKIIQGHLEQNGVDITPQLVPSASR
jgi:hypothetical protein